MEKIIVIFLFIKDTYSQVGNIIQNMQVGTIYLAILRKHSVRL